MQKQFRKNGVNLWPYITPVTVDGRARLRLHSDSIGLGMTKKTMCPRIVTAPGLRTETAVITTEPISGDARPSVEIPCTSGISGNCTASSLAISSRLCLNEVAWLRQ